MIRKRCLLPVVFALMALPVFSNAVTVQGFQSTQRGRSSFDELSLLNSVSYRRYGQDPAPNQSTAAMAAAPEPESDDELEFTEIPKKHGRSLVVNQFAFQNSVYNINGYSEYVVPGRLSVGDNNSADTDNRVIFRQNYFHNAINSSLTNAVGTRYDRSDDLDQYTIGFEKTLDDCQCWSIEMRLPVFGAPDPVFIQGFSARDGSVGNLAIIGKRILFANDRRVISGGLGLSLPTGDDAEFIAGNDLFSVRNEAVHLVPFVAGLWKPDSCWFFHGFLTLDVAATGNSLDYRNLGPGGTAGRFGRLNDQTLLSTEMAAGYWWFRGADWQMVSAVSSMIELNYQTTISSADLAYGSTTGNDVQVSNPFGSFDMLDATMGLDVQIKNRFNLRFAAVLPLRDNNNRFFDSEFQASINFIR